MLLKFTASDFFNTSIVDCATGAVAYQVATTASGSRSRFSGSSLYSLASSSSSSGDPPFKVSTFSRADGTVLAEVTWQDHYVINIKIREESLDGNYKLFDALFAVLAPDFTLLPSARLEYSWRLTRDLLELLDDDRDVIGTLYSDKLYLEEQLIPASKGAGHDYFELTGSVPDDELPEVLLMCLLMTSFRDRLYRVSEKGCMHRHAQLSPLNSSKSSPAKNPLNRLRRQATRSFANLRDTLLRKR